MKSGVLLNLYRVKPKDMNDPEKQVKYVEVSFKYYGKHVSTFQLKTIDDIDYAVMLAKQVFKKFMKSK